jgi:hypothetical protein
LSARIAAGAGEEAGADRLRLIRVCETAGEITGN